MRHWFGVLVLVACCGAGAKEPGDVAAYWAATEPGDLARFVSNDKCYSSVQWLWSCVNAIDNAGSLFTPPYRITTDRGLRLEREITSVSTTTTWFEMYHARERQLHDRLMQTMAYFQETRPRERFDFESALTQMARELPTEIPAQMFIAYAINGHLQTYDAHAYVIPRAEMESWQTTTQKSFVGVGINLDFLTDGVRIHQVFADSPGAGAGLQPDDEIVAIAPDGEHFQRADHTEPNDFYDLLMGTEGSTVALQVHRRDWVTKSDVTTVRLQRGPVHIPIVDSRILDARTGYLILRSFQGMDTCQNVRDRLSDLQKQGATRLILDLRGNAGGGETVALCVSGLFVGPEVVIGHQPVELDIPSLRGPIQLVSLSNDSSVKPIEWERASSQRLWSAPLVVLIDALSASATEIVAGAIQNWRRDAWLVGERTAGKGTVQMLSTPGNNDTLRLARTVSRFYLSDGRSNQVVGVSPNFEVPLRQGASAEDRFYPREPDFFPNTLGAVSRSEWHDPRQAEALTIAACVRPMGNGRDFQMAYALAVLNCISKN